MNYDGLGVDDDMKLNHMIRMMENLRVPQTLKKPAGEILPFVYDIKMVMRDNSYHNFTHVTDNNENTELSKRYNKESPLENHHLSVFGRLCEKHELLANLPTEEEKTRFVDIIGLKCADISNQARPWKVANRWNEAVYKEFYHEGDLDRAAGRNVAPLFDRRSNMIPTSTVGFIGYVVAPLYEIYVAIMKRCAMMDEQVDAQAVEECLVFLQKNKERYQLQADGQYVDQDEEEELQNFAVDLRTKIKSKEEEEEEKTKSKYPGINGLQQQDTIRILMNKIKQHSKHPGAEIPAGVSGRAAAPARRPPRPALLARPGTSAPPADGAGAGSAAGRWSGTIDYLKFVACSDLFSEEMEGAAPPPDDGGGCVDLGEIAVLIDQLKNEDVRLRLESNANLLRIAKALGPERVLEELVPFICDLTDDSDDVLFEMADQLGRLPPRSRTAEALFARLCRDDTPMDSVRLQTVGNCAALFRALEPARVRGTVLPVLLATATDRSWRVRWSAAAAFAELAAAVDDDVGGDDGAHCAEALRATFVGLLNDVEPEVRAALASSVGDLAPALGRDATVARVLPVLLALLRDANAEVRLNIISNLGPVHAVVGVDLLSQSLLPAIVDLADDAKWRVRGAIIEHVPLIADQLGVAFFDDALKAKCVGWLADDVAAIRIAATRNLRLLAAKFGERWARDVAPTGDDPVANVRFNAAATLRKLAPRLQRHRAGAGLALLKAKLRSLADDDGDVDVVAIA
ncbi:3',5'-cyclic-nucleotide phosphodiesterase [Aureococcus anophagefferens]|nr:3',5'-cyclic-nucleotide phosphodiesterase [Aureococcus anophagefferens]